jgi:diguanylate cyclase (GGDEF)-like protein
MTARRIFGWIRALALVAAVILFSAAGPAELHTIGPTGFLVLAGALLLACALAFLRAPIANFERSGRPAPNADRIALLLPLLTAIFAVYGWYAAAAINMLALLVHPSGARRRSPLDRLLTAALIVPIWRLIAPLHDTLAQHAGALTWMGLLIFAGVNAGWYLPANFLWLDPIAALKVNRSVLSYWRVHVRDLGSFAFMLAELMWGYVAYQAMLRGGGAFGLAVLVPPVIIAGLILQLARSHSRVHRLTLSREAVEAMLGAHDPLPQMRSILESIDARITRESVEIFGFGRGGSDAWTSIARLGPVAPGALSRSAARALYDLRAHGATVEGVRVSDGVVLAYAAHDDERRLLGALVVYRAEGSHAIVNAREFERAARELAPLLNDYGTITATRTAASVDTLTGLVNRRAVGRAADEAMAHVRAGGTYALLLIDIDHFKSINDLLGHNAGDRALARVGVIIAENVREGDVAGRFGGEEFIVLMRDADRERALAVAERLRSAIETSGLAYADGAPMTISVGVSYARKSDTTSEALIERADRALYRAKNAGRNRVVESSLLAG